MLLELNIKNFAIIDDLKVSFQEGLNVLTGETGSGKSILIDALDMILGARANKNFIRTDQDSAWIQGVFFDQSQDLQKTLEDLGIPKEDYLTLTREVYRDRPSILRVNNQVVSLNQLPKITKNLVDVFAQHQGPELLDSQRQKEILDSFGDSKHKDNLRLLSEKYQGYEDLKKEIAGLKMDDQSRMREMDLLEFQCQEIEEAQLSEEDEEALTSRFRQLENQSEIKGGLEKTYLYLTSPYQEPGALEQIDMALGELFRLGDYDKDLEDYGNQLESLRHEIKEVANDLNRSLDNYEEDPEALQEVQARMDLVQNLKRKYGNSVKEILTFYEEGKARLDLLRAYDLEMDKKQGALDQLEKDLLDLARTIHKDRVTIGTALGRRMEEEIAALNLENARFQVHLEEKSLGPDGLDQVVFYLSTNLGEDLKPLSQVASGGEMSRMMLGFKSIIADRDQIKTLIFDEIDTGISGKTAHIVSKKLRNLARGRQILVISHLPQMVAQAQAHYKIEKEYKDQRMVSTIRKLNKEDQAYELARLISTDKITEKTLQTAKEMMELNREDI